jgi:hypothetical protein
MPKTSLLTQSKNLRFSKDESKAWTAHAKAAGVSLNSWLRGIANTSSAARVVVRCALCLCEATDYSAREAHRRGTKPYCAAHKGGKAAGK